MLCLTFTRNTVEMKLSTLFQKVISWPDHFLNVSNVWFRAGLTFVQKS